MNKALNAKSKCVMLAETFNTAFSSSTIVEIMPTAKLIEEDPRVFSQSGIKTEDHYALQAVSKFPGSVLIIESGNDEQISHATIMNYIASLNEETSHTYKFIKNADHSLSEIAWELEYVQNELLRNTQKLWVIARFVPLRGVAGTAFCFSTLAATANFLHHSSD